MVLLFGEELTISEAAKLIIARKGSDGGEFLNEIAMLDYKALTKNEINGLEIAVYKQSQRVNKMLGIQKIINLILLKRDTE
ncbi:MAG: hypothetical protein GY804_03820 [Alphaproteobacteria bacterium]|nr:hypothetical protein [Alphaproteobacteria bacterium]